MKFLPRAAILAAVTFCAGALANAATLDIEVQHQPDDALHHTHPSLPVLTAPASEEAQAETDTLEFHTLSAAVAAQDMSGGTDRELNCLAVGVYYEAKGEPLAGQLAVAGVILDRSTSGRFPRTVCSVLTQRGQFSFVRRGQLPQPPANADWRKAMAVAQVAQKNLWNSPVEGALYFHARYVSPGWKRPRVGAIGNHVFYR
jgi:spore germination cell wall hydrolase CwlJ-like protein